MDNKLTFSQFSKQFSTNDSCIETIKNLIYPDGIYCIKCKRLTRHYKLKNRPAYTCKFCRNQIHPLKNTLFEKTSTPLTKWFYALYIMTQSRANIPIVSLQKELDITYKTAWKIFKSIYKLMEKNNRNLLSDVQINKWVFFNKIELKVVHKKNEVNS